MGSWLTGLVAEGLEKEKLELKNHPGPGTGKNHFDRNFWRKYDLNKKLVERKKGL
jgi:hypothetical protein